MKKHENKHLQRYARAGWSLIELLTVVVVLGVAAMIVIPYAASGASASGQSAARLLVTDMFAAQMDAVANQNFRRVHFYTDGSGWCILELETGELADPFDPLTATYAEDAIESQGQNQQSITNFVQDTRFRDITIGNLTFGKGIQDITFDPTGGIIANDGSPSLGGSVDITSGAFTWTITLAPLTGKVSVSDTSGGTP
ncbi:MAG: prepilin-type N-terminal cleavage/methylation domain-containing protein [Planctomycetes bacterium]|nr:prepilin-type N-terminal cleavage/methylation domain-containing protein [Planctomycetota bacterium]